VRRSPAPAAGGARVSARLRAAAIALLVLGVACGRETEPQTPSGPETEPVPEAASEPSPDETPAVEEPAPAPPAPAPAPIEAATAPRPALPAAKPPPPPAAEPTPEEPPAPAPASLSLDELAARIKATKAIGVFTKLALKNDIDALLDAIGAYHERGEGRIDALRERFEALVLKVSTLLEKDEPALAASLIRSREAIWSRLVDPVAFAKITT